MKPVEIKKDVLWVGAVDWKSRDFHGYSMSPMGTTYNAYLVLDEKITLFDTVKAEDKAEFYCRLSQALDGDMSRIDYIVVNHLEPDHAGCLPDLVEKVKPEKIFTSPMGKRAMDAHFHQDGWPVEVVKTGDSISLGQNTVSFIETRMLHWPDSMISYIPEKKLAICNDAFGQNIAASYRYADEEDPTVLAHAMREYYANIVNPYSPVVIKTLDALAEMNLDIDMLAPDHGLIFRGDGVQYALDSYREFAEQKPKLKAVIAFDTMWHSTEKMALAIAEGLQDEGVDVKVMWLKANHHSRVQTELHDAGAFLVGCPTHNNGIMPSVAGLLTYVKGLRPLNKIGAGFGSFGWSGESAKAITEQLEGMGVEIVADAVKCKHVPDHKMLGECYEMGKAVALELKKRV